MSSLLKKRIGSLEKCLPDLPWPDVTIQFISSDGRLDPPDPQPDRLGGVLIAGKPGQPGVMYHRGHDESEQDFLNRVKK